MDEQEERIINKVLDNNGGDVEVSTGCVLAGAAVLIVFVVCVTAYQCIKIIYQQG